MRFDIQFNQGACGFAQMREAVIAAEEAGFGAVWNLDHFSGKPFGSDTMNECFSSLAAWAAVTTTVGLGTLVANVMNRTAGLLALNVATLDSISGGRFTLGVGAGAAPNTPFSAEQDALGISLLPRMAERHDRLVEVVGEVRRILSPGRGPEFEGFPAMDSHVRTVVGVNSPALARRAGEHFDGINVRFNHPDRAEFVRVATEAADGRPFDVSVWDFFSPAMCDADHPANAAFRSIGIDHVILLVQGAPDPAVVAGCARMLR